MAISLDSDSVEPISPAETVAGATTGRRPPLSRHALQGRGDAPTPPSEAKSAPSASPSDGAAPRGPASTNAVSEPLADDFHGTPPHEAERFWNLPNSITLLRAGVVPVLLLHPLFPSESASTAMAWFFIVAAVSDLVDGWLARRGQQVTHIGKLLDPLADKLLVSTALIVLLAMGRIPLWATWMVVTIVGRELAVTGLRGIASAGGQIVAASSLGKLKTVTQNIAIGALLFHFTTIGLNAQTVGLVFLFIATALTIASGYHYFSQYFRGLAAAGSDGGTP